MKKNISINISGIIFHIEEDGYEALKKYLDSINRYFSSFEDSSEILADIESRIAEIFLSKLNEEKQVITAEDVQALMVTMGSVSDFKAAEEEKETHESFSQDNPESAEAQAASARYVPPKQLQRDLKRKILGGVCAGLGNYFNVDPLWIRLLFAALLFAYGITAPIYILMWIIVPGSYDLDEPELSRKMFRDPERKVIGGVSGGVAAYLGIDIILVRVLFLVLVFAGGLGVFLYIILWICLPEARTLTDKMRMQGEPVTLSNIESNIRRNFNVREGEQESTITTILLFPFKVIGLFLTWLSKIIGPLGEVIRVAAGVIVTLAGIGMVLSMVVLGAVLLGIFTGSTPFIGGIGDVEMPMEVFTRAFPGWIALAGIVAGLIPSIFVILLGTSLMARRLVFGATAGWALLALFFICIVMLGVGVPRIVYAFHADGEYEVETVYKLTGKTAILKLNKNSTGYDETDLTLRGYNGSDFKLVQTFEAQGSSSRQAAQNAQMVTYHVAFADSVFTFDKDLQFKDDAVFRGQRLDMVLYIPYDFPFIMDEGMSRFISQYVDGAYLEGYTWRMTRNGLECVNCNNTTTETLTDVRDFDAIEISGRFDLRILNGQHYSVELSGSEREKDRYDVHREGGKLVIEYDGDSRRDWSDWDDRSFAFEPMRITVAAPRLEKVEANGLGRVNLEGITGDDLEIAGRGPVQFDGSVNVKNLEIRLTGKSEADLSGTAENMNARVEFASTLRAYDLVAKDASVEVTGASTAKVNVQGTLEVEERFGSDVDYRGNPQVVNRR